MDDLCWIVRDGLSDDVVRRRARTRLLSYTTIRRGLPCQEGGGVKQVITLQNITLSQNSYNNQHQSSPQLNFTLNFRFS